MKFLLPDRAPWARLLLLCGAFLWPLTHPHAARAQDRTAPAVSAEEAAEAAAKSAGLIK